MQNPHLEAYLEEITKRKPYAGKRAEGGVRYTYGLVGDLLYKNCGYEAYGATTSENSGLGDSVMYIGKEFDEFVGLFYLKAQWYAPALGGSIAEDPIRGGNNWFAYCGNNPMMFTNPTGLDVGNAGNDGYDENGNPVRVTSSSTSVTKKTIKTTITTKAGNATNETQKQSMQAIVENIRASGGGGEDAIALAQNNTSIITNSYRKAIDGIYNSWANKEDGDSLTKPEAKLQIAIGSTEMVGGGIIGVGGCAASNGGSVPIGLYVMGDGGNVVGGGLRGEKVTPFKMLVNDFIVPIRHLRGDFFYVDPMVYYLP